MLDYLIALYVFGRDYHSGSGSKGYRLMCLADRYAKQWYNVNLSGSSDVRIDTENEELIFNQLVEKYSDCV